MNKNITKAIALAFLLLMPIGSGGWLIQHPGGYVGPGDLASFTAWYGLRAYSSAKARIGTTKMVRLRKVATSELCDVLVAVAGGIGLTANCTAGSNGIAPVTLCAGGCKVQTWYDQTGNNACGGASCDLVQNTAGSQPTSGGLGTTITTNISTGGAAVNLTSANNFTPSAALISVSLVFQRANTASSQSKMASDFGSGNGILTATAATGLSFAGGSGGTINVATPNAAWHAANGVINGALSVIMVDSANTTGTLTASTVAAKPLTSQTSPINSPYLIRETGFVDNSAFSSGDRAALDSNQRAYWGF